MDSTSASITSKSGSNLALAFFCLPPQRRKAMSVFYAFCRSVDDIVDVIPRNVAKSQEALNQWRGQIELCFSGQPTDPLACELAQVIRDYKIPKEYFLEIIDGMEMDLSIFRYQTFDELKRYCYRVASAVGLVSIHIFGCTREESKDYAVALGMALQLTNILRDVKYDFSLGRIYLPEDEMQRLGIQEKDFAQDKLPDRLKTLLHVQELRARHFFNKAKRLMHPVDRDKLIAAQMMADVYGALLKRLRAQKFEITSTPLKLSKLAKARLALTSLLRSKWSRRARRSYAKPARIAIWGGGFAGLTAAVKTTLEGHSVDLYEAKSYWGGRAHSFQEHKSGDVIDNSQHIFMGCYTSCLGLFNLLGVTHKLDYQKTLELHFHSQSKGLTRLQASSLPAPLHLFGALWSFKELRLPDRLCIIYLASRMRSPAWMLPLPTLTETVEQWLARLHQTKGALRALWEPLCLAALNEPLSCASAGLFYNVLQQSLFGKREASAIYLNKTPLSQLLMPEIDLLIRSTGGETYLGCSVSSISWDEARIASFQISKGHAPSYDLYISALPPKALASLLPPDHSFTRKLKRIPTSPIIGIHLWTTTRLTEVPILGLLDSPIHWIFDRTSNEQKPGTYLYSFVISGAHELAQTPSQELVELACTELFKHFPRLGKLEIIHSFVYKSLDATFSATPGTEVLRSDAMTPWKNLFLVGDWMDTGLPATLESAAFSAEEAGFFADFKIYLLKC